ncbi:MAG TPA: RDD family protein [Mucilaginibacter sp.]
MQTIKITTSQNIDIDYEVAGLGERIVARLIDLAIFFLIYILALFIGGITDWFTHGSLSIIIAVIVYAVLFVFYDLIFEIFMNGQSIGKRIMKIKVISLDGGQPKMGQYFMRWLFRIVDFLIMWPGLIALIVAAVNEKTQRIGDIVAGTILIRTAPRTGINNIVFMPTYDGYQPVFKEAGQLSDRDIELIHEIINAYMKTGNNVVVYNMALRVKEHLSITPPNGMNDMLFLQTIIKDYNHISAQLDIDTL